MQSTVVGIDKPYGTFIIRPAGIDEFIKTALPLIRNEEYVEKTRVVRAINWFIVANQRHIKIVPTVYPIFWIALEMLANVHAKANGKEFIIFGESEFKIVENKFEALIENDLVLFKLNKRKREKLKANLGCIKRIPIEHRIGSLLKEYGLKQYNSEIKKLKIFRDDVIHGNDLSSYNFNEMTDNERKLKRILEKLILSMLRFYDNDNMFVRSAIRQDRLLALQ